MPEIRETTLDDLPDIRRLWADGAVMRFVGFPEGLHKSEEEMQDWFRRLESRRPLTNHFAVFENGVFCGETYYRIDREHDSSAAMDIKLFPFARGRGIAAAALSFAVKEAFACGARTVWVDPHPDNVKALRLYERLGFQRAKRPGHLEEAADGFPSVYMELKGDQVRGCGKRTDLSRFR